MIGGPPGAPHTRRGFGSRLLERGVASVFHGQVHLVFQPTGLVCTILAPLDARFATSVAAFGEILRGEKHTGQFGYDDVLRIASAARGDDPYGYRSEFLQLVRAAKSASALRPRKIESVARFFVEASVSTSVPAEKLHVASVVRPLSIVPAFFQ